MRAISVASGTRRTFYIRTTLYTPSANPRPIVITNPTMPTRPPMSRIPTPASQPGQTALPEYVLIGISREARAYTVPFIVPSTTGTGNIKTSHTRSACLSLQDSILDSHKYPLSSRLPHLPYRLRIQVSLHLSLYNFAFFVVCFSITEQPHSLARIFRLYHQ